MPAAKKTTRKATEEIAEIEDTAEVETQAETEDAPEEEETTPPEQPKRRTNQQVARKAAAAPADDEPDETTGTTDDEPDEISLDELNQLRAAAAEKQTLADQLAQLKKELKEAGLKVKAFEQEKLSEQEKVQLRAKEAEDKAAALSTRLRQTNLRLEIARAAGKLGVDASLAEKLLAGDVAYDDEGQPVGVEKAIRGLIQEYPQLTTPKTTSNPTNGAKQQGRAGKKRIEELDDIDDLSEDEINEMWDSGDIQRVLTQK